MNITSDDNNAQWDDVIGLLESALSGSRLSFERYWSAKLTQYTATALFALSRYKFACKLLRFLDDVSLLEVGCGEAVGSLMFKDQLRLKKYVGIDMDADALAWNKNNLTDARTSFYNEDFCGACESLKDQKFDAVVTLDVIEHIKPELECRFLSNCAAHLSGRGGAVIIGTPNEGMTPFASEGSKIGHINLYDQKRLYTSCSKYFNNVFIFNMNDEVVHTGFDPMSCYIFAVCCGAK